MANAQEVTLRYYSSKKPPTVLVELPIHVAEMLIDGHANITVNLFDDIRKAIEHVKTDKQSVMPATVTFNRNQQSQSLGVPS